MQLCGAQGRGTGRGKAEGGFFGPLSTGTPVGVPGGQPEMFVRCSDPDIICETKSMVCYTLASLFLASFSCRLFGLAESCQCGCNHREHPCVPAHGSDTVAAMKLELLCIPN